MKPPPAGPPTAPEPVPAASRPRPDQSNPNVGQAKRIKTNETPMADRKQAAQQQKLDIYQDAANRRAPLAADRATATQAIQTPDDQSARKPAGPPTNRDKVTCMVSVNDGAIGSVYFGKYRIRTSHKEGPAIEEYRIDNLSRYQVSDAEVMKAFYANAPADFEENTKKKVSEIPSEQRQSALEKIHYKACRMWMVSTLKAAADSDTPPPSWCIKISNSDAGQVINPFEASSEQPTEDDKTSAEHSGEHATPKKSTGSRLLEVFHDKEPPRDHHMSRGIPMSMSVPRKTITVLFKATMFATTGTDVSSEANAFGKKPEVLRRTPEEKNAIFLDYVKTHAPEFAGFIPRPDPAS